MAVYGAAVWTSEACATPTFGGNFLDFNSRFPSSGTQPRHDSTWVMATDPCHNSLSRILQVRVIQNTHQASCCSKNAFAASDYFFTIAFNRKRKASVWITLRPRRAEACRKSESFIKKHGVNAEWLLRERDQLVAEGARSKPSKRSAAG